MNFISILSDLFKLGGSRIKAISFAMSAFLAVLLAPPAHATYEDALRAMSGANGLPNYLLGESLLRECGWIEDDIQCQLALGRLYRLDIFPDGTIATTLRAIKRNALGTDPDTLIAEALVWYHMAVNNMNHDKDYLADPSGYANLRSGVTPGPVHERALNRAKVECDELATTGFPYPLHYLIDEARERLEYIYQSRGTVGLMQLGEIHSREYFRQNPDPVVVWIDVGPDLRSRLDKLRRVPPYYEQKRVVRTPPIDPIDNFCKTVILEPTGDEALERSFQYFNEAKQQGHAPAVEVVSRMELDFGTTMPSAAYGPLTSFREQWLYPGFNYPDRHILTDVSAVLHKDEVLLIFLSQWLAKDRLEFVSSSLSTLLSRSVPVGGNGLTRAIKEFQSRIGAAETGNLGPLQEILIIKAAAAIEPAPGTSVTPLTAPNPAASYFVGAMFQHGGGVYENFDVAHALYRKSANHKYPDARALCKLYWFYIDNQFLPRDLKKANKYKRMISGLRSVDKAKLRDIKCQTF